MLDWDGLGFDTLGWAVMCNGVGFAMLRSVGLVCDLWGCGKLGYAVIGCLQWSKLALQHWSRSLERIFYFSF